MGADHATGVLDLEPDIVVVRRDRDANPGVIGCVVGHSVRHDVVHE